MVLEVINTIPDQNSIIYIVGSRLNKGSAASGIFSNISGGDISCNIRKTDHCPVALDCIVCLSRESISILMDSRSSISYLRNWPKIMVNTGQKVISKLSELGKCNSVCL